MSGVLSLFDPGADFVLSAGSVLAQVTAVSASALLLERVLRRRAARRHAVLLASLLFSLLAPWGVLLLRAGGWAVWMVPPAAPALDPAASPEARPEANVVSERVARAAASSVRPPAPPTAAAARDGGGASLRGFERGVPPRALPRAVRPRPDRGASRDASSAPRRDASGDEVFAAVAEAEPGRGAGNLDALLAALRSAYDSGALVGAVVLVWALGAGFFALRLLAGALGLAVLRGRLLPVPGVEPLAAEVWRDLGLRSPPRLGASAYVRAPFAFGVLRPVVALPDRFVREAHPDELRAVLLHEGAHILRRDCLVGLLDAAARVLFWFHPLVHLVGRGLARAREELCDNHVLRRGDRHRYSRALLALAQSRPSRFCASWAPSAVAQSGRLEARVAAIVDPGRNLMTETNRFIGWGAFTLFIATGLTVARWTPLRAQEGAVEPRTVPVESTGDPAGQRPTPAPARQVAPLAPVAGVPARAAAAAAQVVVDGARADGQAPSPARNAPVVLPGQPILVLDVPAGAHGDAEPPNEPERVRPGDVIEIQVAPRFQDFPIDGTFRVEADGRVAINPHVGRVKLGGLTVDEAEKVIVEACGKFFPDSRACVRLPVRPATRGASGLVPSVRLESPPPAPAPPPTAAPIVVDVPLSRPAGAAPRATARAAVQPESAPANGEPVASSPRTLPGQSPEGGAATSLARSELDLVSLASAINDARLELDVARFEADSGTEDARKLAAVRANAARRKLELFTRLLKTALRIAESDLVYARESLAQVTAHVKAGVEPESALLAAEARAELAQGRCEMLKPLLEEAAER